MKKTIKIKLSFSSLDNTFKIVQLINAISIELKDDEDERFKKYFVGDYISASQAEVLNNRLLTEVQVS